MRFVGPILYFRGASNDAWRLSALVGAPAEAPPETLQTEAGQVWPAPLAERNACRLWRYDFQLPFTGRAGRHDYRIGTRSWSVHVPARNGSLRLAFTACNGSEEGDAWGESRLRNERWLHLASRHGQDPFHLLLQGGDQLYADPIWREVPELAAWRRQPWRKRRNAAFTPAMARGVGDFYFDAYCKVWSQPELAPLLAQVPSLMLWDDHDIIDGWGSYPAARREADVLQGIWAEAREHFALFQLGARPEALPEAFCDRRGGHFGWALRIGDVGILAPDLRSERTRRNVLGEAGRPAFSAALESMTGCRQVLLLFTVPLVNARLPNLERFFNWIPGHQEWEDDLVDQWPSLAHQEEWSGLLRELVGFSSRTGIPVTSLSGEVHLGALGVIEGRGTRIHQLTSSGIVHPPPSRALTALLERASRREIRVEPDLSVHSLRMPGLGKRYLRARNWLELDLPAGSGLHAAWHAQGRPTLRFTAAEPPAGA